MFDISIDKYTEVKDQLLYEIFGDRLKVYNSENKIMYCYNNWEMLVIDLETEEIEYDDVIKELIIKIYNYHKNKIINEHFKVK